MWASALYGAKNIGPFEIYGVSARKRGIEPVRTFCGQSGSGRFFRDFVSIVLYGQPLMIHK